MGFRLEPCVSLRFAHEPCDPFRFFVEQLEVSSILRSFEIIEVSAIPMSDSFWTSVRHSATSRVHWGCPVCGDLLLPDKNLSLVFVLDAEEGASAQGAKVATLVEPFSIEEPIRKPVRKLSRWHITALSLVAPCPLKRRSLSWDAPVTRRLVDFVIREELARNSCRVSDWKRGLNARPRVVHLSPEDLDTLGLPPTWEESRASTTSSAILFQASPSSLSEDHGRFEEGPLRDLPLDGLEAVLAVLMFFRDPSAHERSGRMTPYVQGVFADLLNKSVLLFDRYGVVARARFSDKSPRRHPDPYSWVDQW